MNPTQIALTVVVVVLTLISSELNRRPLHGLFLGVAAGIILVLLDLLMTNRGRRFDFSGTSWCLPIASLLVTLTLICGVQTAQFYPWGRRIVLWLWISGVLLLGQRWPKSEVSSAMGASFWILLCVWIGERLFDLSLINRNILAFSLFGTLALSIDSMRGFYWRIGAGTLLCIGCIDQSFGLVIVALVALAIQFLPRRAKLICAIAILMLAATFYVYSPRSIQGRIPMWQESIGKFIEHPLMGVGTGVQPTYYFDFPRVAAHAHNLVVSALREGGVALLLAMLVLGTCVVRRYGVLTRGSKIVMIGYCTWSLIDEPLFWWGSATIFALGLTQIANESDGRCRTQ